MAGLDEQCECPLCMEPLEIDDISFYPCTCGYQICRFCWHRIRTDENGLCPACRKQYSEDPAEFKPLTDDELQRIKKERRQKDVQRKQKAAESRKHLANVRVVQRNLVFVVGLSQRLADPDQLRKPEYFGKFGKIHKVVINQSTSYAGAQGPSASAYVTYTRPGDALKAILNVNNVHIDGRTLKASLGTTKYCSHFLKGTQCQKVDCMYLHDLGEEAASFTKEEMQMGKHQEYEQKLLQQYQNSQNVNNHKKKASSPLTIVNHVEPQPPPPPLMPLMPDESANTNNSWPALNKGSNNSKPTTPPLNTQVNNIPPSQPPYNGTVTDTPTPTVSPQHRPIENNTHCNNSSPPQIADAAPPIEAPITPPKPQLSPREAMKPPQIMTAIPNRRSLVFDNSNSHSLSLFSGDCFTPRLPQNGPKPQHTTVPSECVLNPPIPDNLNIASTTDWQAAFGFTNTTDSQDEDLGFDPLEESAKGLADLMQKERVMTSHIRQPPQLRHRVPPPAWPPHYPIQPPPHLPPGFSHPYPKHILPNSTLLPHEINMNMNGSRMMGLMNGPPGHNMPPKLHQSHNNFINRQIDPFTDNSQSTDLFATKDWQDGLRALLPNINISFGPNTQRPNNAHQFPSHPNFSSDANMSANNPWLKQTPQFLDTDMSLNHRLPFVQQFTLAGAAWPPQTRNPPPGFHTMPPNHTPTDQHTVTDPMQ